MMVLLPEGRAINNPDTIKMIKIMPSTLSGKQLFVVAVKLDDDSELMIQNCTSEEAAIKLAEHCTDLINKADSGDEDSEDESSDEASDEESEDGSDEESSDWDSE